MYISCDSAFIKTARGCDVNSGNWDKQISVLESRYYNSLSIKQLS